MRNKDMKKTNVRLKHPDDSARRLGALLSPDWRGSWFWRSVPSLIPESPESIPQAGAQELAPHLCSASTPELGSPS